MAAQTDRVVSEIAVGEMNEETVLVYALQDGGSADRADVYRYVNGAAAQVLQKFGEPCEFTVQDGKLYFLNKESLYSYDGTAVQEEEVSGVSNYRILSDGSAEYLLANIPGAAGSELYLAEKENGKWGEFRQYTNQGGYIRDYDAVFWKGAVHAAVNRLLPDLESEGFYTDAALLVTGEEEVYDLAADYVYYEEKSVVPGEKLPLEIGMTNHGKNTVTKITAVIRDENGDKLSEKRISCRLAAQESMTLLLEYGLPEQFAKKISVELSIPEEEITEENNTVSTEIHYVDLAVKNAACQKTAEGGLRVTGTLENLGLEEIKNIRTGIYASVLTGKKLGEVTEAVLQAGETADFEYVLSGDLFTDDADCLNGLMIYAESDAEERNYVNNEARLVYDADGAVVNPGGNDDPNRGQSSGTLDTEQKWEEDTDPDPADLLLQAKERGKEELSTYKNLSDYREAQQKELAEAVAAGKTAIDAAEDEAGVNRALSDAKAAIDQIKTNEQLTLEEQKKSGGGTEKDINSGKTSAPEATSIKGRIKAKSRGFLVKWKKQTDADGYQIQYSANKKFKKKGTKMKTVKKPSLTKLTVKKLKSGKKYYVRVRTYKTMNGVTLYSGWSKAKTVKVK